MGQTTTGKVMRFGLWQEAGHQPRPTLWQMLRTAGVVYSFKLIQGSRTLLLLACRSTGIGSLTLRLWESVQICP